MDNTDLPQDHSPDERHSRDTSDAEYSRQSRLEKVLGKGSLWKKNAMRDIQRNEPPEQIKTKKIEAKKQDRDTDETAKMLARLSIKLDERNLEIERLRKALSALRNEKSQLDRAHRQAVELHQTELQQLQDAYDQFEKESDGLLSELGEQNERLLNECRYQNSRSLLKP